MDRMNKAIFSLGMRRNYLINLKRQQLDPNRDNPLRAFLPPVLLSPVTPSIEWSDLTFLLNPPGQGDLLSRFALCEEGFQNVLALVQTRLERHSNFQERFELWQKENPGIATGPTLELVREAAGGLLFLQLTNVTEHLYESAERALTANRKVYTLMTEAFVRLFPKNKHVKVEERPAEEA
jgi:hypothetical protein